MREIRLSVICLFVLLPKILDAGRSVVSVTDDSKIFEDNSDNQPDAGKKNSDRTGQVTDDVFHDNPDTETGHSFEWPVLRYKIGLLLSR